MVVVYTFVVVVVVKSQTDLERQTRECCIPFAVMPMFLCFIQLGLSSSSTPRFCNSIAIDVWSLYMYEAWQVYPNQVPEKWNL